MSLAFCEVHFDKQGRIVSGGCYYDQYTLLTQLGHIEPEKRPFFLENANFFEPGFTGVAKMPRRAGHSARRNINPQPGFLRRKS